MLRFYTITIALGLLIASTPIFGKVISTSENGFVTKASVSVAATPRETWLALVKPGLWWNDEHSWSGDASNMTLVPSAGECFCETIPGEGDIPLDGSALHAVVVQAVPDRALRLRGEFGPLQAVPATGVLTVTLEKVAGGTRINWEYNVGGAMGVPIEQMSNAVDAVMTQQLIGLRDHLGTLKGDNAEGEGGSLKPDSQTLEKVETPQKK